VRADNTMHVSFSFHFNAAKRFFAHIKQIDYVSTILQRLTLFLLLNWFEHSNSCGGLGGATAPGGRVSGATVLAEN
jgi:hypothetical protein